MGYQTDFVGYLHVDPPLNDREIKLVNTISGSIYLDQQPAYQVQIDRFRDWALEQRRSN